MMSILRFFVGVAGLLALAYVLFLVDVAGKPIAGHILDVWRSPPMQEKVGLVREGVRHELEDRLAAAGQQGVRDAVQKSLGPREDIADDDRRSLEKIIDKR